jgi:hypothetical protein
MTPARCEPKPTKTTSSPMCHSRQLAKMYITVFRHVRIAGIAHARVVLPEQWPWPAARDDA